MKGDSKTVEVVSRRASKHFYIFIPKAPYKATMQMATPARRVGSRSNPPFSWCTAVGCRCAPNPPYFR